MKREIKFRAYHKDYSLMEYDSKLFPPDNDYWDGVKGTKLSIINSNLKDSDIIFNQFTGLKDKNGKDIYEEDVVCDIDGFKLIVNYLVNYKLRIGQNESDGTVYYSFITGYMGKFKDGSGYTTLDEVLEVIGNVYENPELL